MLSLEELLEPVPGENPSGRDLRYDPISAQIREARRFEEDLEQGVWRHEIKKADYPLVIRLATKALKSEGKDLQVAAWLTEALIHESGYEGLRQGLELVCRLLEQYWETVYPAIDDDGDLELRATPLAWIGTQLDHALRSVPLTSEGYSWFDYHFARTIPSDEEAAQDETKRATRQDAMDRKRPTVEAFEEACKGTPIEFYERLRQDLAGAMEQVERLARLTEEKFGDVSPGFAHLREQLGEMEQTVRVILVKRRETEPPPHQRPAAVAPAAPIAESHAVEEWGVPPVAPPPAPVESWEHPEREEAAVSQAPNTEDAIRRVAEIAGAMRFSNPYDPVPYLLLRAARWGELYAAGRDPDESLLEAPPKQVRVELKRLWQEADWHGVRESGERAMALPCGRAWLDLQRYVVRAAENTGCDTAARALRSAVRMLLRDYPSLPDQTLNDDTPAAGAETRAWLDQEGILGGEKRSPEPFAVWSEPPLLGAEGELSDGRPATPDAFELAMQAARGGRTEEALAIIARETTQEVSGRGRFLRKIQLAQICLATGNESIGLPVLEELDDEIERRRLEEWEAPELVAQPLAMLVSCLDRSSGNVERRQRLYARICRLDPARALTLVR
jgi:type VI secretion system protein ImpA